MNKIKTILIFIIITLAAFAVRFYQLGINPPSLDWDEASIGYNAYTILKTGKDEFGNFLPLSIRSFNDYKASVYVYLTIIPVVILGLTEFSIRFTSAFSGSLTVIIFYFIFKKILEFDSRLTNKNTIALIAMAFLALSPWHIQFSRVAFEANLALFFVACGLLFFLNYVEKKSTFALPAAILFWGISLFTYHAQKIFLPVFIVGLIIIFRKKLLKNLSKTSLIISFIFLSVILFLLLRSSVVGGQSRFFSSSIFSERKTMIEYGENLLSSYLSHFDINFLFILGDWQARHHAPQVAQLLLVQLPLVIIGLVFLLKFAFKANNVIFLWLLLAPLPAVFGKDSPNAVRSLLMIPILEFISACGIIAMIEYIKKPFLIFLFVTLVCANFLFYLHMYFIHMPWENSQNWQYGYKQVVDYVNKNQNKYERIIVTDAYDQPYIYFLLYEQPMQILFNNGEFYKGFGKYIFRPINWQEDKNLKNTLLVGTPDQIGQEKVIKQIDSLSGKPLFRIVAL